MAPVTPPLLAAIVARSQAIVDAEEHGGGVSEFHEDTARDVLALAAVVEALPKCEDCHNHGRSAPNLALRYQPGPDGDEWEGCDECEPFRREYWLQIERNIGNDGGDAGFVDRPWAAAVRKLGERAR